MGINTSQSSLARVSLVNYHGVVIMDEYVKKRERVVNSGRHDQWCDIKALILTSSVAKPFKDVQMTANKLLDGRILIGHAIHNDLKALVMPTSMPLKY